MSQPPTIEYATPAPPRRRAVLWIVLLAVVLLLIGMIALFFFTRVQVVTTVVVPSAKLLPAAPAAVKVIAPSTPSRVTIIQRREQALEGSQGTVIAHIGDITGGQTLLTIRDSAGNQLLSTRSVGVGDVHSFTVGNASFDVEVPELNNFLTGEDYAVLAIRKAGAPLSEEEKIQALIDAVANTSGLIFIRNNDEHDAEAAAQHLRRKYHAVADKKPTAQQFIDEVASRSSASGEEYRVKLPDGRIIPSREWLSQELSRIESGATTKPAE